MTYGGFLLQNPFFWAAVGGAGVGGAFASLTRIPGRSRDPDRARARKWAAFPAWLTITAIAGVLGMLLPPVGSMLDMAMLPTAGVAAGLALFIIRFPRALGIPLVAALVAVAVVTVLLLQPFLPLREQTVVGRLTVLSISSDTMRVEVTEPHTPGSRFVTVPGGRLAVEVTALRYPRELFFTGAEAGVRLSAIGGEPPQGVRLWRYELPADGVFSYVFRVPGVEITTLPSPAVRTNLLRSYAVVANTDGTVELRRDDR